MQLSFGDRHTVEHHRIRTPRRDPVRIRISGGPGFEPIPVRGRLVAKDERRTCDPESSHDMDVGTADPDRSNANKDFPGARRGPGHRFRGQVEPIIPLPREPSHFAAGELVLLPYYLSLRNCRQAILRVSWTLTTANFH